MNEIFEASFVANEAQWSKAIVKRDKACRSCGVPVTLQAAHIVGRNIKHLKLCLLNGVTLCHECHREATDGDKTADETIMRRAMVNTFGFDFYDALQHMKYNV